jgi:hypothetical protein
MFKTYRSLKPTAYSKVLEKLIVTQLVKAVFAVIIIIIIIIIGKDTISLMQGIYTYIPETNHVPKEYNVAAILSLLFMVPISLAPALALMYFYIGIFIIIIIIIVPLMKASVSLPFVKPMLLHLILSQMNP